MMMMTTTTMAMLKKGMNQKGWGMLPNGVLDDLLCLLWCASLPEAVHRVRLWAALTLPDTKQKGLVLWW
jgi:hypothetical protein